MSPWLPIEQIPDKRLKIDILAKRWKADTDSWELSRFVSCRWIEPIRSSDGGKWGGVPDGWRAVAYMIEPEIPKQWPMEEVV